MQRPIEKLKYARGVIHACTQHWCKAVCSYGGSNVLSFATLVNACRVGVFVLDLCIGRFKFPGGNSEISPSLPSNFHPAVSLNPEVEELSFVRL